MNSETTLLSKLPPPPPGKSGWPWTEESEFLPPLQPDGKPWPRISIVTPSFNQGHFIEETIRSVLLQNYPELEYIIIDGKSSDNTVDIIKKYEGHIKYWVSEPDKSQSQAINKGFYICTGELVNWICSDDLLIKNAFFNLIPEIYKRKSSLIIGAGIRIDENSNEIDIIKPTYIKSLTDLVDLGSYWRNGDSIMQQSCLFPLEAVKKSGYLNESNHYTMDYELWGKLLINRLTIVRSEVFVGNFRWYGGQKTSNNAAVTKSLIMAARLLINSDKDLSVFIKSRFKYRILVYKISYHYHNLRSRIGIKRRIKALFKI